MLRDRFPNPRDEDGTSMVEVMVGLAMGMLVLAGVSMLLIVTLHGNARIDARAEAGDNARVTMTRIIEEMHSACVSPTEAPIKSGSDSKQLIFTHGTYGQAADPNQTPITTTISYSGRTLWETDTQNGQTSKPRALLSNVSEPKSGEIFQYRNLSVQPDKLEVPLDKDRAGQTILVTVAFTANPKSEPVSDAGAATEISNNATLRLTPPTYDGKEAKPCE